MRGMARTGRYNLVLLKIVVAGTAASALLPGCGGDFPFARPLEIEQGQHLEEEAIAQLEEGMSRAEVARLLGEPVLEHPFHEDRWDYLYRYQGAEPAEQRRLTLRFEEGELVEITNRWNGE